MTKEEYMKAGRMCVPVVCNGIGYARISEVVVKFSSTEERNAIHRNVPKEIVFLRLQDRNRRDSGTLAPPEKVDVDPEWLAAFPGVFGDGQT